MFVGKGSPISRKAGGVLQNPKDIFTEIGKWPIRVCNILMLRELFTSIEPDPLYGLLDFTKTIATTAFWWLYDEESQTQFYLEEFSFAKKGGADGERVVVYIVTSTKLGEDWRLYGYSIPLYQQSPYASTAWAADPSKWRKIFP